MRAHPDLPTDPEDRAVEVPPPRRGPGRPPAVIDLGMLERLASLPLPAKHMAFVMDISPKTLEARLAKDPEARDAYDAGRETRTKCYEALVWQRMIQGRDLAVIWWGKNKEGWRDNQDEILRKLEQAMAKMSTHELQRLHAASEAAVDVVPELASAAPSVTDLTAEDP